MALKDTDDAKPEGEGVLVLDALLVPTAHNPSAT